MQIYLNVCDESLSMFQGRKWYQGSEHYGKPWKAGDVIGCMLDLTDRTISMLYSYCQSIMGSHGKQAMWLAVCWTSRIEPSVCYIYSYCQSIMGSHGKQATSLVVCWTWQIELSVCYIYSYCQSIMGSHGKQAMWLAVCWTSRIELSVCYIYIVMSEHYGKPWKEGDVIGCMLDLTDRTISMLYIYSYCQSIMGSHGKQAMWLAVCWTSRIELSVCYIYSYCQSIMGSHGKQAMWLAVCWTSRIELSVCYIYSYVRALWEAMERGRCDWLYAGPHG